MQNRSESSNSRRSRRLGLFAIISATLGTSAFALLALCSPAHAQVAADGAAGVNVTYEAGTAPYWYIEEQRVAATYIQDGVDQENPALISQGLQILDWGFAREAADGSYPGTGDGTAGEPYHSTSMFLEAAARATLVLQNYHPITYTLDPSTYSAKIAQYKQNIHLTAEWLMGATDPSVPVVGQEYDAPYTHRRYILAAALQETAVLTGDTSITPVADQYIQSGLSLQLPNGWIAAVTKNTDGTYPPATLVPPGQPLPANTVQSFSAEGVNPEANGYDVNYQAFGLEYAEHWMSNAASDPLYSAVQSMLTKGLAWEQSQVSSTGCINSQGNSRVGLETSPDGSLKTISPSLISDTFLDSTLLLGTEFQAVGNLVEDTTITINSTKVGADGAAGVNINWEAGTSSTWEISEQIYGVDWISAGIAAKNTSFITKGISVLNWGFAHQSSDGSFGTSADLCFGTARFVEAAARATLLLKNYDPTTYASDIAQYTSGITAASAWMTGSEAHRMASALSVSVADEYAGAAALGEAGALTNNAKLSADALPYAQVGLSMQLANGENPENGAADTSWQVMGIQYAQWYYPYCTDAATKSDLITMMVNGLNWEMGYIAINGTINGQTPIKNVACAFQAAVPLTGDEDFQIVVNRINND